MPFDLLEQSALRGERGGRRFVGPALVAVALVATLAWTRDTWADPIIDFGNELYLAWRLAAGAVLYRDVAALHGPLSPYWNALWFRALGTSLRTLELANLAVLAALLALVFRALRRQAGETAATLGGLTVVLVFACGQLLPIANYNWLCPYSHEMTHGIVLSLLALAVIGAGERLSASRAALAGVVLGLVFLTKGEVFLAALAGFAVALALDRRATDRRRILAAVSLGFAVPPLAAFLLLRLAMPAHEALVGTFGTLAHFNARETVGQAFYRQITGLDDPMASLRRGALWTLGGVAYLAPGVLLSRLAKPAAAVLAAAFGIGVALFAWQRIDWSGVAAPLPLLIGGTLVATGLAWRRGGASNPARVERLGLLVFALALLAKLGLRSRLWHYGFGLALPATACAVALAWSWVPRRLEARGGQAVAWRTLVLVAWVACVGAHLRVTAQYLDRKTVRVGSGADAFLADARGSVVAQAVEALGREPETATLVAIPEGAMLNYLARRPSSVPYQSYIPHALAVWGEERIVGALAARPPSVVVLVGRSMREFGAGELGRDYGVDLMRWVDERYAPIAVLGGAGAATRLEIRHPLKNE